MAPTSSADPVDPVFVLYGEQQIYLNLWSLDILSITRKDSILWGASVPEW